VSKDSFRISERNEGDAASLCCGNFFSLQADSLTITKKCLYPPWMMWPNSLMFQ